ncbi:MULTISPECIES: Tat pathway signal protein [Streptomyces]|uniref:Tat pathway signal protein n=1 Tax=Streptomyces lonegramiae TaxID=3075524 RepID=A0ABU2XAD9_9ACTN|nr:Tat pathway signal protein [Streptomyces sp. DSM 41529]MDT0542505.1 Tat pathway signal protein [Streptomyces sp. DSM 41529]
MTRTRNEVLAAWMAEHGVSANGLATQVNSAIAEFTGSYGTCTERGVFRWLSGEVTWPHARQRVALERVTGRTSMQLGFRPRGRQPDPPASLEEDPMYRRAFLTAATAAGASLTTSAIEAPRRLGSTDVDRLNEKLAAVVAMDDRYGGTPQLEQHALSLAQETLDLQQRGTASSRIRSDLYAVASAFTSSAMWAAIDGRRLDAAQGHLNQAVTLAGLAGDSTVQFRVWGHAGSLYRQLGRYADAMAASEASRATAITRRDPLFTSLALARLAVDHADSGDARAALRAIDQAQDAFDRADHSPSRPTWMRFFDQAELDSLALFAHLSLGKWAEAEHHAHRCLTRLRPDLERNRALTHANLALAQLGQGDIEPAVASAMTVAAEMAHQGRVRKLLGEFTYRLNAMAPKTPEARAWRDHRMEIA